MMGEERGKHALQEACDGKADLVELRTSMGYVPRSLAMVPEGWGRLSLGEFTCPKQWPTISKAEFTQEGFPVFGANGIIGRYFRYNHEKPAIVVTCRGATCGEVSMTPPMSYITGNAMAIDNIDSSKADPSFLFYALKHRGLFDIVSGSAQPQIIGKDIKAVRVNLPPLPEQRKIAQVLSTWDRAVELTEALLVAARTRKRGLMQILLTGRCRFSEFEGQEWREVRLGEVATIIVSNVDKKSKDKEWPVRLCNYTDVYKCDIIKPNQKFMESTATLAQIQKFRLNTGDVIITKDSETADDIAIPTYVAEAANDLVCGYHLAIIRSGQIIDGRFLKFYFELPHIRHYFKRQANGAIRFGLTISSIENIALSIPSIKEQRRIACILTETEIEILTLNKLHQNLRIEKKALMQKLLTGEWRVKVEDPVV